jgi:hypothetical protein
MLVAASLHTGCGSSDPYGRNLVVPEGSIYDEPAQVVRTLGYTIAHVDTIIGFIDAYNLRGGSRSQADRILLDVFTAVPSGQRVVTIAGQSLTQVHVVRGLGRISGRPTTPSFSLRQDAATLFEALGCAKIQMEQRMTPDGIELDVWCAVDRRSEDT